LPGLSQLLVVEMEAPDRDQATEAGQLLAAMSGKVRFAFDNAWYAKAGLAARMQDTDQAFDYLEQSVADPGGGVRNTDFFGLSVADSLFLDPLREQPRFVDWLARYQLRREAMLERMNRLERAGEIIEPATVARAGAS